MISYSKNIVLIITVQTSCLCTTVAKQIFQKSKIEIVNEKIIMCITSAIITSPVTITVHYIFVDKIPCLMISFSPLELFHLSKIQTLFNAIVLKSTMLHVIHFSSYQVGILSVTFCDQISYYHSRQLEKAGVLINISLVSGALFPMIYLHLPTPYTRNDIITYNDDFFFVVVQSIFGFSLLDPPLSEHFQLLILIKINTLFLLVLFSLKRSQEIRKLFIRNFFTQLCDSATFRI